MLKRFGRATGTAPLAQVFNAPPKQVSDPWNDGEMDKIVILAGQAESLVQTGQSLLFLGAHTAV